MGVVPAQDPGSGKTDRNIGKSDTAKSKPSTKKAKSMVPPSRERHHRSVLGDVDRAKKVRSDKKHRARKARSDEKRARNAQSNEKY
jgi:hypothetical protein